MQEKLARKPTCQQAFYLPRFIRHDSFRLPTCAGRLLPDSGRDRRGLRPAGLGVTVVLRPGSAPYSDPDPTSLQLPTAQRNYGLPDPGRILSAPEGATLVRTRYLKPFLPDQLSSLGLPTDPTDAQGLTALPTPTLQGLVNLVYEQLDTDYPSLDAADWYEALTEVLHQRSDGPGACERPA